MNKITSNVSEGAVGNIEWEVVGAGKWKEQKHTCVQVEQKSRVKHLFMMSLFSGYLLMTYYDRHSINTWGHGDV